MIYTKDEKVVDWALRSAFVSDLDKLGQAYELESRNRGVSASKAENARVLL